MAMLEKVMYRCGFPESVIEAGASQMTEQVSDLIEDALEEMRGSGVPESLLSSEDPRVITTVTMSVQAYRDTDRTDTDKYLDMFRRKTFRLTLDGGSGDNEIDKEDADEE